jgi:hypothetical protein
MRCLGGTHREPVTQSLTEKLRASSKAEQKRRDSVDRPGWEGHSVLADQERESSHVELSEASVEASATDPTNTSSPAQLNSAVSADTAPDIEGQPPRGPSRISGDKLMEAATKVRDDERESVTISPCKVVLLQGDVLVLSV